jgi:hypothetical protein
MSLVFRSDPLSGTGSPGGRDQKISWTRYVRTLLREEIIVLIFLRFVGQYRYMMKLSRSVEFLARIRIRNCFLILVYEFISSVY